MNGLSVETATRRDLSQIADIYHHYVLTSPHTFDLEPFPSGWWRDWFTRFDGGRYCLVVAREAGGIVGYAASDRYRTRGAYSSSIMTSVYVAPDHLGQGVGTVLYRGLFGSIDGEDVHRAYAGISMPNTACIRLHERFGFTKVGYFTEQGRKFGRYWDVAWYERRC